MSVKFTREPSWFNKGAGFLKVIVDNKDLKYDLGGYSGEVPPLPIPNREVKLTRADGTAVFPWESR